MKKKLRNKKILSFLFKFFRSSFFKTSTHLNAMPARLGPLLFNNFHAGTAPENSSRCKWRFAKADSHSRKIVAPGISPQSRGTATIKNLLTHLRQATVARFRYDSGSKKKSFADSICIDELDIIFRTLSVF